VSLTDNLIMPSLHQPGKALRVAPVNCISVAGLASNRAV
jgi:hypothetical protein